MLDKLGAANRTEAVTRARELDLLPCGCHRSAGDEQDYQGLGGNEHPIRDTHAVAPPEDAGVCWF